MTAPQHHIPEPMMAAYVAGNLPQPFAVVVATHISMCDECRARHETHLALGGAVLESLEDAPVSDAMRAGLFAMLDEPAPEEPAAPKPRGIYPAPLADMVPGDGPRWRSIGMGARQSILWRGKEGSLRLLYIPAGQAVPDHSHNGLELTLVLQGSFSDEGGRFGVGDVEVADEAVEHTPLAGIDSPCICLAATDAPLRFSGMIPRLLQPVFRI
ncbi:anti-ECFsigma factor, ChrR [Salinihabitans flavidus]|uniref:Anti-ECFsigma factor, ChrR n=1 Tax=Salinihabitans flavidus TaxID=569882 RepID=A0A1H8MP57_9RHOB|nr:ChrR family anti-sigma-E factor [Salinihabitans flavidus]SEO19127.1 anti-ECFsigma factor, ChrR [Salinihabitans flavidus]